MGSQRVGHDWATDLIWSKYHVPRGHDDSGSWVFMLYDKGTNCSWMSETWALLTWQEEDTFLLNFYFTFSFLHSSSRLYTFFTSWLQFSKGSRETSRVSVLKNWHDFSTRPNRIITNFNKLRRWWRMLVTTEWGVYACFCNLKEKKKKVHLSHLKRALTTKWNLEKG